MTRFLGLNIDHQLKWGSHINNLCLKLSSACYGLLNLKKLLDIPDLKTVYYSVFYSRVRYGIMFWGQSPEISKIFLLQKKAIRIILNMRKLDSCRGSFKNNNILTVYGMYIFESIMFMHKHINYFNNSHFCHDYDTRLKSVNYRYPKHRLTVTEKGLYYSCIKLYNYLPLSIRNCNDSCFKYNLKRYLITTEPYSLAEYYNNII